MPSLIHTGRYHIPQIYISDVAAPLTVRAEDHFSAVRHHHRCQYGGMEHVGSQKMSLQANVRSPDIYFRLDGRTEEIMGKTEQHSKKKLVHTARCLRVINNECKNFHDNSGVGIPLPTTANRSVRTHTYWTL